MQEIIIRMQRKKKERWNMSTETKTTVVHSEPKLGVKAIVKIGMLAAVAVILMLFEIPLPFAPSFYEIDFSEVPVLVGCFAMGPFAGALIELIKILLNFVLTGTQTAGVGEIANFIIGCALCVPAGLIYRRNRTRKNALIGMACDYDCCGMCGQRFYTPACLCNSVRDADGCPGGDGSSGKSEYHEPDNICGLCGWSVQYPERSSCIHYRISHL